MNNFTHSTLVSNVNIKCNICRKNVFNAQSQSSIGESGTSMNLLEKIKYIILVSKSSKNFLFS